jgi:hypothetical protein
MSPTFRRLGKLASFSIVAGVAATVSYIHIRIVALLGHQPAFVAYLLPLAIDGLIVYCSILVEEDKAACRYPRGWARFGFWSGALMSITANVTSTAVTYHDPISIGVSAVAPFAFLVVVEAWSRPGKPMPASAIPAQAVDGLGSAQPTPASPAVATATAVPDDAAGLASADLPAAPVSPAPAGQKGRPQIPVKRGPGGAVVRKDNEQPVAPRTARRVANEQPERLDA